MCVDVPRLSWRSLVLSMESAYHRLLLHGCCQFYCLTTVTDPGCTVRVGRTRLTDTAPRHSLVAFLQSTRPEVAA